MKESKRSVSLRKLPNRFDRAQLESQYREMEICVNVDRPRLVLDCSMVERLDRPVIRFLLCSLEEALKRNGDIRLAAMHPELRAVFESMGLERLFQVYPDVDSAIESFRAAQVSFVSAEFVGIKADDIHVEAA